MFPANVTRIKKRREQKNELTLKYLHGCCTSTHPNDVDVVQTTDSIRHNDRGGQFVLLAEFNKFETISSCLRGERRRRKKGGKKKKKERKKEREREKRREGEKELHNKTAIQRFDSIPHNAGLTSAHSPTHFTESNSTLDPTTRPTSVCVWWGVHDKGADLVMSCSLYIIVHRKDTFIQINSPCQVYIHVHTLVLVLVGARSSMEATPASTHPHTRIIKSLRTLRDLVSVAITFEIVRYLPGERSHSQKTSRTASLLERSKG